MATTDKYDRQLRLWGANGQKALSETTVMLLRATAAGTETLKNLVLPGVGTIVIVDDALCTGNDAQQNFFVVPSGRTGGGGGGGGGDAAASHDQMTRAKVSMTLLQELNPDVKATYQHVDDMNKVNYVHLFESYTNLLVVAADLEPSLLDMVARCCQTRVPLIVVQSYGLMGLVRLQTHQPLFLFDSKPTSTTPDLRLVTPIPAFVNYCNSIDMESMEDHDHSHVPYPVILYKLQQHWKETHHGELPTTFSEKQQFRETIQKKARKWDQQMNFQEAYNNAYLAYTEKTIDPSHLATLIETANRHHHSHQRTTETTGTTSLSISSPQQLLLLSALTQFLNHHSGQAPLGGTLPDMTSSTTSYVQLQQLYHDQAQKDALELKSYMGTSTSSILSDELISSFCNNVFDLNVVVLRTLHEEYCGTSSTTSPDLVEEWQSATWDPYEIPEHTPLLWYIGLRACRLFHLEYGRYPGVLDNDTDDDSDDWELDIDLLHEKLMQVCHDMQLTDCELIQQTILTTNPDNQHRNNIATELTRYANAEIHTIASIVGGVASQEAVKLITGQYTPLNNTYVYNGIASVGAVYQF